MRAGRCINILIAALSSALIFSGCAAEAGQEPLAVEYYYYNTCASCEPEKEFLEDFEAVTGISRVTTEIEVKTYNVFSGDGEKAWKKAAKKAGVPEDANFPVLKVGDEIVCLLDTAAESIGHREAFIIAFISSDCAACEQAGDGIISKIPDKVEIGGVEIKMQVKIITLTTSRDAELFKKYCEAYHVKNDMWATPIVFVGRTALSGAEEIEKLADYIELGRFFDTKIITQ